METATPDSKEQAVAADVEVQIGDTPAAAETNPEQAVKWFEIVEVKEAGFTAFCRLPNDFQHKDIREKSMAAKARRRRQLRNPSTDAFDAIEGDMETLAEGGDDAKANLVFELLMQDIHRDRMRVVGELDEEDEWKLIHQDQERFRALQEGDEEGRTTDEWKELVEHLSKYADAINAGIEEAQKPRKEALESLDLNVLVDKVRDVRVDNEARRAFNDTYSFWQMYVGTLRIPEGFDPDAITRETLPRERVFPTEADLHDADPTVVAALQTTFENLEGGLATLTSGNS